MTTAPDPAPTTVPAASTVPSAATTRPRRVDGLGTATAVLLGLSGLAYASSLYVDWSDYRLLSDHVSGRITGEEFWAEYSPFAGPLSLLLVAAPFAVAAAVVLLVWVHRARTNAGILSPGYRFRFSPAFSVGGLFVPFANYWWSRPILEDIVAGSSPHRPADATLRLVRVWWGLLIGNAVAGLVTRYVRPEYTLTYDPDGSLVEGGREALQGFLGIALGNTVLVLVVLPMITLLAVIVRRVSRQQTELLFPAQRA